MSYFFLYLSLLYFILGMRLCFPASFEMGRAPCCEKVGLKRGRWTAEEDDTLIKYIKANGEGNWKSLPKNAGLLRCGKSCRLRWINYLRGDLKRGNMTLEEDELIVKLHKSFGNRWSMIASHLPGRTDNEIKNYWNSRLSRQIYRFFTGKTGETQSSTDVAILVNQKTQRVGRVSRNVAKKYNNDKGFKNYKPPDVPVTKLSSPPIPVNNQVDPNIGDCSTFVPKNVDESPVYDINIGVSDEFGFSGLRSLDDEAMDIGYFLESEAMDSSGVLSIRDEDQIEQMLAETYAGNLKYSERNVDEREYDLSFSSSKTICSGFNDVEWDMEVGFTGFEPCDEGDDMLVWLWEDGNP
ncbi:unnamed protein product [Lactuca saligna]|uniref:Uncharacterized protein n=1 Tax=Lactuca saligna TaxID=75948 RepID=A0AA35ZB61_LACSI|nr:unnamed protein product [Lactuca saligna]